MELIDRILDDDNIHAAIHAVRSNKGAPGIDKMSVGVLKSYFAEHGEEIKQQIRAKKYQPQPVRRVYIPKANGKMRPLGIPTVVDRVIQQAIAQVLSRGYERYFSEFSYGFRPNRDCHMTIEKVLEYLNSGYEWVIDLDIEKYFDSVNHDKLISILRERINDAPTLYLIRSFLKAGVMEDGLVSPTEWGVPQGGLCRYPHKPPWRKPWMASGLAISHTTGKSYSLLNQMLLGKAGEWLTFGQVKQEGGHIRKGEKARMIVFWKFIDKEDETTGEINQVPFLRYYSVFHIDQCDGIKAKYARELTETANPDENAENIIAEYVRR